ncbi:MAG: hypothetical protein ACT4P1_03070 [Sporichthyaceae bacterium]
MTDGPGSMSGVGSGVEVELGDLDAAASSLAGVADALAMLDVLGPVEPLTLLVAGAESSGAAVELGVRFAAALSIYTERVTEVCAALSACASSYREADQQASDALTAILRRMP